MIYGYNWPTYSCISSLKYRNTRSSTVERGEEMTIIFFSAIVTTIPR